MCSSDLMGGLYVDPGHRTSLNGLYAAGECACQYHGANRLGGNSLLGAAVGGKTAAETLLLDHWEAEVPETAEEDWRQELEALSQREGSCSCAAIHREAVALMKKNLGIRRCEAELNEAADGLRALLETIRAGRDECVSPEEQRMEEERLVLSLAMVGSAEARKESRGAHCRTDYPGRNDEEYQKTTLARLKNGAVEIAFAKIPKEGEGCMS